MKKILSGILVASLMVFGIAVIPDTSSANHSHERALRVTNTNETTVVNTVTITAMTGNNTADGGEGDEGGNGGPASSQTAGDAIGGSGGPGGNGGMGGIITTGDIFTEVAVSNTANINDSDIELGMGTTTLDDDASTTEDDVVENMNSGTLDTLVEVTASTGENRAHGARGARGGDGAPASSTLDTESDHHDEDMGGARGGDGAMGGDGGIGGDILTGLIETHSDIVNVINRNITRIRR